MVIVLVDPAKPPSVTLFRVRQLLRGKGRVYWGPPPLERTRFKTRNGVKRTLHELRRIYKSVYVCLPPYKEVIKL